MWHDWIKQHIQWPNNNITNQKPQTFHTGLLSLGLLGMEAACKDVRKTNLQMSSFQQKTKKSHRKTWLIQRTKKISRNATKI